MKSYKSLNYIIPTACFCLFYITLWNTPFLPVSELPFVVVFGLSATAYFVYRKAPNKRARNFFLVFALITVFSAYMSLFRAPLFERSFYNSTLLVFNLMIFYFFIPILSVYRTRLILVITHVTVATVWCFEILMLLSQRGQLTYLTFAETGSNKNHIGFCLAISAIICFYYAINGEFKSRAQSLIYQGGFFLLTMMNFYCMTLIYARGSLAAAIAGSLFIMAISLKDRNRFGKRTLLKKGVVFVILLSSLFVAAPTILEKAPSWERLFENMTQSGGEKGSIGDRKLLIDKGFAIIGDNPLLGVGVGGGRERYGVHSIGLMHNTYLATWVDLGILGLLAIFYWIYRTVKLLKIGIVNFKPVDKIWLSVTMGVFVGMLLKDLGTLTFVLITILAAMMSNYKIQDIKPTRR